MAHPLRRQILNVLWPEGMPSRVGVYTVLDCARDQRIFVAILGSRTENCCLFAGDLPGDLEVVSPSLVKLDKDSQFANWLIDENWGRSWGIFLRSDAGFKRVCRHLRSLLRVRCQNQWLLFRYYDPRVLAAYLPTCSAKEVARVFGPITDFFLTGAAATEAVRYISDEAGSLVQQRLPLPANDVAWSRQHNFLTGAISPLVIRADQMQVLANRQEERFIQRLLNYLTDIREEIVGHLPPGFLRMQVVAAVDKARSYGLTWESTIAAYVDAAIDLGPQFDQYPAIRQILTHSEISGNDKPEYIRNSLTAAQWSEARAFCEAGGCIMTPG